MASIFDSARNILNNLKSKATSPITAQGIGQNQPINYGNAIRQAPVAIGKAFIANQALAPWAMQKPEIPKLSIPQIKTGGSAIDFIGNNLLKPVAESIINTPSNIIHGSNLINQGLQTQNAVPLLKGIGYAGEGALNLGTFGTGSVAKSLVKPTIKQAVEHGILTGGGIGAGFGLANNLQSGNYNLGNLIKDVGGSAIGGALLGGAGGALGGVIGKLTIRPQAVEAQLRDQMGRWTAGEKPVKPQGMPKAQWDFQLNFNNKYGRNPYQPVYYGDLNKAVDYEVGKRGVGLSIRDVNKDKNPLGTPPVANAGGVDLSYLAGIVDGEGHIRLTPAKNGQGRAYMRPDLIVVQKDKPMLEALQKAFGGRISKQNRPGFNNVGNRDIYRWELNGSKAVKLAQQIQPLLIQKAEQVKRISGLQYDKSGKMIKSSIPNIDELQPIRSRPPQPPSNAGLYDTGKPFDLNSMQHVPDTKRTYAYFDNNGKKVGEIAYGYRGEMNYKGETSPIIDIAKIKSNVAGTGVGTKVVEALKQQAQDRKARLVVDWVEPKSVGFWQKMGFKVADTNPPKNIADDINWNTYAIYDGRVAPKNPLNEGPLDNPNLGTNIIPQSRVAEQPLHDIKTVPQQETLSTNTISKAEPVVPQQTIVDGGQGNGVKSPPSNTSISQDPIMVITNALKEAKPLRGAQEALYSAERAKRVARVAAMGEKVPGEKGYFAQLGQLKGALPKQQFESIRSQITQPHIDSLFNQIEQSRIFSPFEKVTAKGGFAKLLGAEGGQVPTQGELKLLSEAFPKEFIQAVLEKRSIMQKLWAGTEQALNLPRSIMATLDLSAPLRQGIFLIGRPKQFLPAFRDMFKYAGQESAYKGLMEQIQSRPTYQLMRQSKLALTDMGETLGSREEAFMSNLSEKIPVFGTFAKGSNRAYSGFLNKLRADTFDDLVKTAQSQGIKVEGKVLDDIANFVNTATGRGKLPGAIDKAAVVLNSTFFSPRLMASRMNLLNPVYYAKLSPVVRKEALKSLLTFAGTAVSVLTLAKLGGADVSADPRSSDFGKIKMGNTRYDILGGFQQYLRLAGQLITGQKINSQTGKLTTLGEGFGAPTRKDILLSFFESKTAPVASFAIALLKGKDIAGNPFNLPTEVINRFIPMVISDMYDISKENGNPLGVIPGIFGTGVQTYGKTEMVQGKNQLGEPTSQVRPVQGLGETITEKLFGMQPLGNSGSSDVQTYYNQLKAMPRDQANAQYAQIVKTNPDLAKQIIQVIKDNRMGITVQDKTIRGLGVKSGDRAKAMADEFNKLKTREEKNALYKHYVSVGLISPEIWRQIKLILKK